MAEISAGVESIHSIVKEKDEEILKVITPVEIESGNNSIMLAANAFMIVITLCVNVCYFSG